MLLHDVAIALGLNERGLRRRLRDLHWPKDGKRYMFSTEDLETLRDRLNLGLTTPLEDEEPDRPGLPFLWLFDESKTDDFVALRIERERRLMQLVRERLG